jgi:hypothetical protein
MKREALRQGELGWGRDDPAGWILGRSASVGRSFCFPGWLSARSALEGGSRHVPLPLHQRQIREVRQG